MLEHDGRRPFGRLLRKTGDEDNGTVVRAPRDVIPLASGDRLRREPDDLVAARRERPDRIEEPYQIEDLLYGWGPPCGWTTASCASAAGTHAASMGTFSATKAFGKPRSR